MPGKHCHQLWRTNFEIDEEYIPIKAIGKGAYGVVCSAKHVPSGEKVAIKKITNAFENLVDARRTLREMMLLRNLRHENIISIKSILRPVSKERFDDIYLVLDLMDTDLHQIIRSSQALSDDHFQYFIYQVRSLGANACPAYHSTPRSRPTRIRIDADPARAEVRALCARAAPRPQAEQPAPQRLLRPENLRFWPSAHEVRCIGALHGRLYLQHRYARDALSMFMQYGGE